MTPGIVEWSVVLSGDRVPSWRLVVWSGVECSLESGCLHDTW